MNYSYNTPLYNKNKHLTVYERGQIQLLNCEGLSPYAIAKRLGRASNTIRNELKRGTVTQIKASKVVMTYFPETSQINYENNRRNCGARFKALQCHNFLEYVCKQFFEKSHSLDAIYGSALLHGKFSKSEVVCTKTLYNYVNLGILSIANIDLPLKVKRTTKTVRVKKHKKNLGTSIDERPEHIKDRSEFGHWEIDTVIGEKDKTDSVLLTITERKTRKEIIRMLPNKASESVLCAMKTLISEAGDHFSKVFKSITSDNGLEFADLSLIEAISECKVYFAHPYASSERGTNERHNGLIRRFIPKGKRISDYSIQAISRVQNWCNSLPRKILNYLTPDEAFEDELRIAIY